MLRLRGQEPCDPAPLCPQTDRKQRPGISLLWEETGSAFFETPKRILKNPKRISQTQEEVSDAEQPERMSPQVGTIIIIPALQVRKLRLTEVKNLPQISY